MINSYNFQNFCWNNTIMYNTIVNLLKIYYVQFMFYISLKKTKRKVIELMSQSISLPVNIRFIGKKNQIIP